MKNFPKHIAQQCLLPIILIGFVMFSLCWSTPIYSKNTFVDSLFANKIYTIVEQKPEYVGGDAALFKFLCENIKYPKVAREKNMEETVYVGFFVNTDGSISDFDVKPGVGGGCSEEAVRVVGSMPKWSPGRQQGRAVRVAFTLFYLANYVKSF